MPQMHPPTSTTLWCLRCRKYHPDKDFYLNRRFPDRRGHQLECRWALDGSARAQRLVLVGNILTAQRMPAALTEASYSFGNRADGVDVAARGTMGRLRTGLLTRDDSPFLSMDGTPCQTRDDMDRVRRVPRYGWKPVALQHVVLWWKQEMGHIFSHRNRVIYARTGAPPLRIDMSTILHREASSARLEGKQCVQTPEEHWETIFATTSPGQKVLELCAGTCAASKAARMTGRRSLAIEIDPVTVRAARLDPMLRKPIPPTMVSTLQAMEQQLIAMRRGVPRADHATGCPTCWVSLNQVLQRYPMEQLMPLPEGILGHPADCLFCMSEQITMRSYKQSAGRAMETIRGKAVA